MVLPYTVFATDKLTIFSMAWDIHMYICIVQITYINIAFPFYKVALQDHHISMLEVDIW